MSSQGSWKAAGHFIVHIVLLKVGFVDMDPSLKIVAFQENPDFASCLFVDFYGIPFVGSQKITLLPALKAEILLSWEILGPARERTVIWTGGMDFIGWKRGRPEKPFTKWGSYTSTQRGEMNPSYPFLMRFIGVLTYSNPMYNS